MRRSATVFALALCVAGCGLTSDAPLVIAEDTGRSSGCVLSYFVADVVADPKFGVVYAKTGKPVVWPSGTTGHWVRSEVEVTDIRGKVVVTTPGRYRFSPIYLNGTGAYDGPMAVCFPEPCPDCEEGEGGPM